MRKELQEKILAYNRAAKARQAKADDMDVLIRAFLRLPPGQLKKVLTDKVLEVLAKYGYTG